MRSSYTVEAASILIERWRRPFSDLRSHSTPGQRPPPPETLVWPGVSLDDYAPALTREAALTLSREVYQQMGSGHCIPGAPGRTVDHFQSIQNDAADKAI